MSTHRFAVVVENSGNGTSVFYATVETAILRRKIDIDKVSMVSIETRGC